MVENRQMTPLAHGVHGAEDGVRLLLTETPPAPSVAPGARQKNRI